VQQLEDGARVDGIAWAHEDIGIEVPNLAEWHGMQTAARWVWRGEMALSFDDVWHKDKVSGSARGRW
jgi:hypothetical protein